MTIKSDSPEKHRNYTFLLTCPQKDLDFTLSYVDVLDSRVDETAERLYFSGRQSQKLHFAFGTSKSGRAHGIKSTLLSKIAQFHPISP